MNLSIFPHVSVDMPADKDGPGQRLQGWLMDIIVTPAGAVKAVVAMMDEAGKCHVVPMSRVHYMPEEINPQVGSVTIMPLSGGQ